MRRIFRILKRTIGIIFCLVAIVSLSGFIYLRQPQFGKAPAGERLKRIEKSPHYRDGKFRNRVERPVISEGHSFMGEVLKSVFKKYPHVKPVDSLPSIKTDLRRIPADSNVIIWFGHSSVLIQVAGKRLLVDPVFSGKASPLPWGGKAFKGSDIVSVEDLPAIDYLLISHDHYDHLDYETVLRLRSKVGHVLCGLGVGAHFEHWGYAPEQIIEKDWDEEIVVDSNFSIFTAPSQHESGRGLARANTLWMSYLVAAPGLSIYISGDGGYDNRFEEIGNRYGPIDWAIMECGQYDSAWQSVHNLPEQVMQATLDLKARNLLPVHHSKFSLSRHPWDEPLKRIKALSEGKPYRLATPMIGEPVRMGDSAQVFRQWWTGVK